MNLKMLQQFNKDYFILSISIFEHFFIGLLWLVLLFLIVARSLLDLESCSDPGLDGSVDPGVRSSRVLAGEADQPLPLLQDVFQLEILKHFQFKTVSDSLLFVCLP